MIFVHICVKQQDTLWILLIMLSSFF